MRRAWAPLVLLAALLASLQAGSCQEGPQHPEVPGCEGKRIALLDLSDLAGVGNYPKCNLNEVVQVNLGNGIAYSPLIKIDNSVPHMFGTHSAPWFLAEAIRSSKYYTTDAESADIVYVYDYCYYIWWLGDVHAFGREKAVGPGDFLFAAYNAMMQTPLWKKHNGGNFAFYDPHPGFIAGNSARAVQNMKCFSFRNAIHLIVDTPMRNVCEGFALIKKILVTPYTPNPLDVRDPYAYLRLPPVPLAERTNFAYSRARCAPYEPPSTNAGKLMRYWFSFKEWGQLPDVDVRCTDRELNSAGHQDFRQMFEKMRHSVFCPAFPGDAASTRRLSEIFLAGCIPVFLGPPYHSMPFSETVPYKELGVFFNISDTSKWLINAKAEWRLHPTIRAVHETEARWWVPDTDVNSASDVLPRLKAISHGELERKLKLMAEYGSRFSFMEKITEPPNAINSLLTGMCRAQTRHPAQLAQQDTMQA